MEAIGRPWAAEARRGREGGWAVRSAALAPRAHYKTAPFLGHSAISFTPPLSPLSPVRTAD
jgi:hypothetical protein